MKIIFYNRLNESLWNWFKNSLNSRSQKVLVNRIDIVYWQKKRSKDLIQGPGAQKIISVIELYTTFIKFNILSRTLSKYF